MTVATPRSPIVQGRYCAIRVVTGWFPWVQELPRSPWNRFPQNWRYWTQMLVCTPKPSSRRIALTHCRLQTPDWVGSRDRLLDGVPGHHPREEEADGERHPRGDEIEAETTEQQAHGLGDLAR